MVKVADNLVMLYLLFRALIMSSAEHRFTQCESVLKTKLDRDHEKIGLIINYLFQ